MLSIWILTFEFAGVAKFGGLGEVPANQAKHLSDTHNITILMPSHGQVDRLKSKYEWIKLPISCEGEIDGLQLGLDTPKMYYQISFYQFMIGNLRIILLSGENPLSNFFLDDTTIYNPDTINGKICLYSHGMRCISNHIFRDQLIKYIPDVIHLHDYHVVLPFIALKQVFTKNKVEISSILTIHLLTWPRFGLDYYSTCGIDSSPIKIRMKKGFKLLKLEDIIALCYNDLNWNRVHETPTVEKVGAIICDMVTSVSQSYLNSDIIPNCGGDLIDYKADFIWDGCDWEYQDILESVMNNIGNEIREFLEIDSKAPISKSHIKKYLLQYKIGNLSQSPLISSKKVLDTITEISNGNPFIKNGNIKPFTESGSLMLTTGRISPQKGFETIFKSLALVTEEIPDAKFLFLILPTDYSLSEIKIYAQYVKNYPNNLRIIFGVASDIFYLAHIAADVYCAASRWEPFGIMALEAMASKLPIIATKVGGLQETIVDVRDFPEIGTGILIEKDDHIQLAHAIISLFKSAEIAEKTNQLKANNIFEPELLRLANQIPDEIIKSRVLVDPSFYDIIRENCYKRVKENFTWDIVSKKLIILYDFLAERSFYP
ncbi:MAG: glycogen/starch synthase [Candidatus Lokiarchaeota archaeon]|nr:glycogen/starch synthase [Candidatus Lokiarchaeota archaeon]